MIKYGDVVNIEFRDWPQYLIVFIISSKIYFFITWLYDNIIAMYFKVIYLHNFFF